MAGDENAGTTNGATTNGAPTVGRRPANGANGQPRPSREEVIAGLTRMANDAEAKPETKPEPPPAEKPKEPEPLPDPEDGDDTTLDEDAPDEKGGEAKRDEDAAKTDPDLAKRLAIVSKHEKRSKEREAQAKAALDRERQELRRERETIDRDIQAARSEIEAFTKLKDRARFDAAGVLRALGLTDDDMEPASRQLWALSKAQAADPKNREAAGRMMRERESDDRITKLERELADQKQAAAEAKAHSEAAQKGQAYLASVIKAATDEHPLAKRLIEKSPERSREKFAAIASELFDRDGDLPDAEDVLAEYEKRRRTELEEDGVDVAAMLKPRASTKANAEGSRTLGNDIGSTTATKSNTGAVRKTQLEKRAELEAELRAMDLKRQ